MATPFLCGAVLLGTAVHALVAPAPAPETRAHLPFNAMNPIPTPAPMLSDMLKHQLGRRADDSTPVLIAPDNTCGYISGLSIASFTCFNPDALCVLISSTSSNNGIVGCCGGGDCGFRTTCIDSFGISAGSCDSSCSTDTMIVKCSESTLGFCNSISFPGGAVDYFCGDVTVTDFLLAETSFSGQTGRSYSTFDLAETSSTDSSSDGNQGSSSFPPITNIGSIPTTPTPTGTNTPPPDDDKGSNTGVIVGGVVGGLAVLALIILGAWLILRKKKSRKDVSPGQPPQHGQPQLMYQAPQSMYYDPNNPNQPAQYNPQQGYQQQQQPGPQYNSYQNAPSPPGGIGPDVAGAGPVYYGVKDGNQNLGSPEPNRAGSTSPVSNFNRNSTQPVSPGSTLGAQSMFLPLHGAVGPHGGQTAPVEAAGNPLGQVDRNAHHRGQLHELG